MTFVYPLGSGSKHDNLELKISLRSIEKFAGEVFVIGEKPHWITGVQYVPFPDHSKHNKDGNMIQKVLKVCGYDWVDDIFIRMSDDHVVLSDHPKFHPYYYGLLDSVASGDLNSDSWKNRALCTVMLLRENDYPTWNFDTHAPVVVNKHKFVEVMDGIDKYFAFYDRGYVINSLYFNMCTGKYGDVYNQLPDKHVLRLLDDCFIDPDGYTFLNYNDYGFTDKLKKWLLNKFPEPSRFEK